MKIYFCEKCGVSIPLQQVVAGKATARDGKTYCFDCKPAEVVEDDLKLYFCDNCRVSIPLQDVIHNHAKTVGEKMMCSDCVRLTVEKRVERRNRVELEQKEKEESRYRLHFCDRCNTSIPQSHIVTGRSVVRGGRTLCERCKTKVGKPKVGLGSVVGVVVLLGVAIGAGYLLFGGGGKLFGAGKSDEEIRREEAAREAEVEKRIREAVDGALADRSARDAEAGEEQLEELENTVKALEERNRKLEEQFEDQNEVADGILTAVAGLRTEIDKGLEQRLKDSLRLNEDFSALRARIAELERRPAAAPPPPAEPREEPKSPDTDPAPEPRPEPAREPPAEVKVWIDQLGDKDAGVRFSAAVELGKSGYGPAAAALARVLQKDKDTFVRRAAARSLGELDAWSEVPVLIGTLEDREIFVATTANEALKSITGQEFGYREGMSKSEVRRVIQKAKSWWGEHQNDR